MSSAFRKPSRRCRSNRRRSSRSNARVAKATVRALAPLRRWFGARSASEECPRWRFGLPGHKVIRMDKVHDALVIGGGPAGATAALLLARAGWCVVLLERKPFPRRKVCGEYLSATNLPLLDRLGVGAAFRELAGPEVTHVGLFAAKTCARAALPRPGRSSTWGRALSREQLDTLLLREATRLGV